MLLTIFLIMCGIMGVYTIAMFIIGLITAPARSKAAKAQAEKERAEQAEIKKTELKKQAASDADALLKYKHLLDDGAITQEEFDTLKKNLLG